MPRLKRSQPAALRPTEIARRLQEEILSGRLREGQHLAETKLAARFEVSRGMIREAVQHLSLQGLVVRRPNCGAVVAPEAPKSIRRLVVPIRRAIEVHALRQVIDDLDDADFRKWDEILERMHAACREQDFHGIAEADITFHRLLLERAGQPDLLIIWEALVGRIRSRLWRNQRRCPDLMGIHDEHRQLAEAFRSGDERAAVELLKEKIA